MAIVIDRLDPRSADARALLAASDELMAALYPAESNHLVPAEELARPEFLFLGAFEEGRAVASAGIGLHAAKPPYGEIKRLFVLEAYRGRGLSKKLMARLERHAGHNGCRLTRLEVGVRQPEAISLYRQLGYVERPPFGDYKPDPLSLFMEKILSPSQNSPAR